ncbi:MAG: tetratricopeptide repeat protein [Paludibacter sp.]|jgi:tetratricopeptide (TPR) repeat protein|nr:tetratricopeptide repeat protein [Paludibacter sp.]
MTRRPTAFLLVYLWLVTLLTACTPHPNLTQVERLFDSNYDSACALLQTINPAELCTQNDKALYALSVTRGRFYQGTPDANDSLISIATAYYDRRDPHRAALAWFYMAKTCALNEHYDKQVAALLKAQHYCMLEDNHKLQAYIFVERAALFGHQQQPDSALINYRRALKAFAIQHDTLNAVNTEMQMAVLYIRLKHDSTAESICRRLLQQEASMPLAYRSALHRMLGSIYHSRGHYRQAAKAYRQTPLTGNSDYDDNLSYLIAKSYIASGQHDSAEQYLRTIDNYTDMAPDYHKLWAVVHQHRGNYPAAMAHLQQAMTATDSLYHHRIDQSFSGLEKKFNYQKLKLQNQKLEIVQFRSKLLVLICFIGIAGLAVTFYIYRNKAKLKQLEMDKKLLEQEKIHFEKEVENAKLIEHQLILQRIVITNLEQYRKNTHRKPEHIKEGFSPVNNEHFYHELYSAIDIEYNNLSHRIREVHTQLNENDILICCLILAGFDTGMMASIFNIKFDSMNMRRSRLRKKLNLNNSESFIDYLRNF